MKEVLTQQQREECIGDKYYYGEGSCEMDPAKAMVHYKNAMRLGSATACFKIGRMYDSGKGQPVDRRMAAEYYKVGAKRGDAKSIVYAMQEYFGQEMMEEALNCWQKLLQSGDEQAIAAAVLPYLEACRERKVPRSRMDMENVILRSEAAMDFWEQEMELADEGSRAFYQQHLERLQVVLQYYAKQDGDEADEESEDVMQD